VDDYPERWHMSGAQARALCRRLYKQFEILHLPCQYTLSLMNSIINNQENFQTNSSIHNIDTRNKHHFIDNMSLYLVSKKYILCWHQNFQQFLHCLTILKNEKAKFKAVLSKYLKTHSFLPCRYMFYV
jgi:hypothetical protein